MMMTMKKKTYENSFFYSFSQFDACIAAVAATLHLTSELTRQVSSNGHLDKMNEWQRDDCSDQEMQSGKN